MELLGKTAVITGATQGLGKALVLEFLNRGSNVIASSNSSPKDKKWLAKAWFVKADVTKEKEINSLCSKAQKKYGTIDIWINNAGIWLPHSPAEEMDLKKVHAMMDVNLFGTIHGCRAAFKAMRAKGQGIIVNVLSTSALEGRPDSSGYCASKFAAMGFTKSFRQEIADEGLTLIGIYPAYMKTDLFNAYRPDDYDTYMEPAAVAEKIVENLALNKPIEELIIRKA